jgi:hypothetical protein
LGKRYPVPFWNMLLLPLYRSLSAILFCSSYIILFVFISVNCISKIISNIVPKWVVQSIINLSLSGLLYLRAKSSADPNANSASGQPLV